MQFGSDVLFTAPGPDAIPTATTEIVGTPGNGFNVYWIVSHFPIGSVVSGPFPQKDSPNVLDNENFIHISWLPTPGASSYDLLVTKDLQLPTQPGRFLLQRNLTETEFRDRGFGLDFYDLAGIPLGAPQEEHIFFNNRDFKQPTLRFIPWPIEVSSIIFPDGSEQTSAGGGGGGQTPWLSDIDAASNSLLNVGEITGAFEAFLLTAPSFGTVWLGVEGQNTAFGVSFNQVTSFIPIQTFADINVNSPGRYLLNGQPFGGIASNPAGGNTELQWNDNGLFGASPNLRFDDDNSLLTLGQDSRLAQIDFYSFGQLSAQIIADWDGYNVQFQTSDPSMALYLSCYNGSFLSVDQNNVTVQCGASTGVFYINPNQANVQIGSYFYPSYKLNVSGDINITDPGGAGGFTYRINGVPIGGGGGTPAGANTQIQYNNNGAFGASANLTWTSNTRRLNISGSNAEIDFGGVKFASDGRIDNMAIIHFTPLGYNSAGIYGDGGLYIQVSNDLTLFSVNGALVTIGADKFVRMGADLLVSPYYGSTGNVSATTFSVEAIPFASVFSYFDQNIQLDNLGIINATSDLQIFCPGVIFIGAGQSQTVNIRASDIALINANYGISVIQCYSDLAIAIQGYNLRISNLPTSSAGLSSGVVWNNAGVLNIVP